VSLGGNHRRRARGARARPLFTAFQRFARAEAFSGVLLLLCAVAGLAWANSPWQITYEELWHGTTLGFAMGDVRLELDLLHWVNDGLMAVFFLLVGLEIKRELLLGELARPRLAALPIAAALGGMLAPAGIYLTLNAGGAGARGWGVPVATDIAFALGVMAILGRRVPTALKVFITALAIVDDMGAVVVIAVFYTSGVALGALAAAGAFLVALMGANRAGVRSIWVYAVLGLGLWLAILQSGVHASIAGVALAMTVPARVPAKRGWSPWWVRRVVWEFKSLGLGWARAAEAVRAPRTSAAEDPPSGAVAAPMERMEHALEPWVAYGIMPVFALANAGVALGTAGGVDIFDPVTLGVILGLMVGKPVGITLAAWAAVRAGLAHLPRGVDGRQILGAGMVGGIGFTMSLFIAALAFGQTAMLADAKLGVLGGSLVSGALGYLVLRWAGQRRKASLQTDPQ